MHKLNPKRFSALAEMDNNEKGLVSGSPCASPALTKAGCEFGQLCVVVGSKLHRVGMSCMSSGGKT